MRTSGRNPCHGAALVVFMFLGRSANAQFWSEHIIPAPLSVDAGGLFGWSIDLEGDILLVGAPGDENNQNALSGSAYIFERNLGGADQWGLSRKLEPNGVLPANSRFGRRVILRGDTAFVGAPYDEVNGTPRGAIYVFERNAGGPDNWGQVQRIVPQQGPAGMRFGWTMSLRDGFLLVGAPDDIDPDSAFSQNGGVLVFEEDNGLFQEIGHWIMPSAGLSLLLFSGKAFVYSERFDLASPLLNPCDSVGPPIVLYLPCYITPFDSLVGDPADPDFLPYVDSLSSHIDSCTFFVGDLMVADDDRLVAMARGAINNDYVSPLDSVELHRTHIFSWKMVGGSLVQDGAVRFSPPGISFDGLVSGYSNSLAIVGDRMFKAGNDSLSGLGGILVYDYYSDPDSIDHWSWTDKVVHSDPEIADYFGWSISAEGYDLVAGSPLHGADDKGKVYVFQDPTVSVPTNGALPFQAGPVPASTTLTIRLAGSLEGDVYAVRIIDAMGHVHATIGFGNASTDVDVSLLANGVYILQFIETRSNGYAGALKFIVAH